jgi:hypothetical protein
MQKHASMCIAFEQRGWAVQASHASEPFDIPARTMKATLQEHCSSNTSGIFGHSGKSNRKWFCIRHVFLERSAYNFSHSWVSVNATEKKQNLAGKIHYFERAFVPWKLLISFLYRYYVVYIGYTCEGVPPYISPLFPPLSASLAASWAKCHFLFFISVLTHMTAMFRATLPDAPNRILL